MMVLTFNEWLTKRDNTIGAGPKTAQIDLPNGTKVTINGHESVDDLYHVEYSDLKKAPPSSSSSSSSSKTDSGSELENWSKNVQFRKEVLEKLLQHYNDAAKQTSIEQQQQQKSNSAMPSQLKVKNCLRTSVMKNILENKNNCVVQSRTNGPFIGGRMVVTSTHGSLISMTNQLLPYLLDGVPVSLITGPDSAPCAEYLLYLLKQFGLCDNVVEHSISFSVTQQGQTLAFVLFEDADVDAALDSALDAFIQFGWSSIKIFAQETLKRQVETVFEQKLKTEYSTADLILEDGLYPARPQNGFTVDVDAVDFETTRSGIDCFYFRSLPEALKMINFLKYPISTKLVSVWSENAALAMSFVRQLSVTTSILINSHVIESLFQCSGIQKALYRSDFESYKSLSIDKYSGNGKEWRSLSSRERASIICKALNKIMGDDKSMNFEDICGTLKTMKFIQDDGNESTLKIVHLTSIGIVSVDLAPKDVEKTQRFLAFIAKCLIYGNTLCLNGPAGKLAMSLEQELTSNGYRVMFINNKPFNISTRILLSHNSSTGCYDVAGVHLDNLDSDHLLKRIKHSITLSIPEFDMGKIVE